MFLGGDGREDRTRCGDEAGSSSLADRSLGRSSNARRVVEKVLTSSVSSQPSGLVNTLCCEYQHSE